mgnify:CR=1 FL=1
MKCPSCGNEADVKDKFCSHCGSILSAGDKDSLHYLDEIHQFSQDQEEAKSLEKFDDLDLNNPTGILKAQLRMLISIYKRLEKLENKTDAKVRVVDFDMHFWSMVGFEFKVILVGLFLSSIFFCLIWVIFYTYFKDVFL